MDVIHVEKELRAPSCEELTHAQKVDRVFKVGLGLSECHTTVIVFQLFECDEELRCNII